MTTATAPAAERPTPGAPVSDASGTPRRGLATRIVTRLGSGVVQVVLALVGIFWLVPTIGLLFSSLRSASDNANNGWWHALTKPSQLTFDNYQKLLDNKTLVRSFLNTVLITVPATLLVVIIGSLAAYAFAWLEFRGRDWAFIVVVALLVVPIQVALYPVATLYGHIGLFGTIPGVVLFHVSFGLPFAIFLLRNFFAGIPRDLLEAARMDGASELRIFVRVILPLGLPAIASLGIFQFLWVWNDLLVALVFAGGNAKPLTVTLQEQTRAFSSNIDVLASGAFLSLIVPLIVFFSFQRYFVQGVLAGSVK
ncbi:MAG: alpha-glucoside transport system permease protein [Mycobacteriales bacterium]|jgi:alpha-glucoside transport system permease protein